MEKYNIPGASLAIAKDGAVIWEVAAGFSDKSTGESVKPSSLFRIASLSKPITSITILSLVEKNAFSLDDKVFGEKGILNEFTFADVRVKQITIRQLLNHTSGGWRNNGMDPMFRHPSLNSYELIKKILKTTSLDSNPGTDYGYSNFGYCILGRVIEKVSGLTYEEYIYQNLLKPLNILNLKVGGDKKEDRAPGEVTYYAQEKTGPYEMKVNRMDAHGGWIASASDLLKLLTYADGLQTPSDILSPASVIAMSTPSAENSGYALGWQVNKENNWWHTGCLPGTASIIVRTNSGYSWTLLLNSRSIDKNFFHDIDKLIWRLVKNLPNKPEQPSLGNETKRLVNYN